MRLYQDHKTNKNSFGPPKTKDDIHSLKEIWAIGGGKGGIGKSFISCGIAHTLAKLGKRVVLVDLDLGSANLHTCLGLGFPKHTLSDFISSRVASIEQLLTPTLDPNLKFISGAHDALNVASLDEFTLQRIKHALKGLNYDYLLLDLGAGTSVPTLDFFTFADRSLLGLTPEPTSIENAYRFLKSAFYHKLKGIEHCFKAEKIVEEAMDQRNNKGIRSPWDLIHYLSKSHPHVGCKIEAELKKLNIHLIVNQVRSTEDLQIGESVEQICRKYFGLYTKYAGYLDWDDAVWQALRKGRPLVVECPQNHVVKQLRDIVMSILELERKKIAV